jgi:hypothetical protein
MKLLFSSILLLVISSTYAQVSEDWVSPDFYYGLDGEMVVVDADDNAFTLSDIFNGDIYLTKRSPDGTILWTASYDNTTPSQWEEAGSVTIDINGDAIVTGYTNTGFGSEWFPVQMVTMKFNGEDGTLLWRETYSDDVAYRGRIVLSDTEGNIYVGGDVNAWMIYHGEVGNTMLKKYDADGNEIWSLTADDLGNPIPGTLNSMLFDAGGNLVLASNSGSLMKVSPAGDIIWLQTGIEYGITDIDLDPSGNIFVASQATFGTIPFISSDITIKKFSSTGDEIWSENYGFGNEEFSRQITCDGTGGAYIIGYGDIYFDWITFKVDADGNQLWSQIYDEHTGNDEIPKMMVKDSDDNIYVTGQGGPWPGYFWTSLTQMVTIKYTPYGAEEWVALHTDYTNTGSAICLASDNSIYAVGQQYAVTIHYNQVITPVCDTPEGLFSNNITSSAARLNWTIVPDAYQYEVWYKKTTAATWKKKFVLGTKNKLNIKNLQPSKEYVWKIRTICDTTGTDLLSDFSADQFFTTLPLREGQITEQVTVYPNPANEIFHVQWVASEESATLLHLFNLNGQVMWSAVFDAGFNNTSIVTEHLPTGLYLLTINDGTAIHTIQVAIE